MDERSEDRRIRMAQLMILLPSPRVILDLALVSRRQEWGKILQLALQKLRTLVSPKQLNKLLNDWDASRKKKKNIWSWNIVWHQERMNDASTRSNEGT